MNQLRPILREIGGGKGLRVQRPTPPATEGCAAGAATMDHLPSLLQPEGKEVSEGAHGEGDINGGTGDLVSTSIIFVMSG